MAKLACDYYSHGEAVRNSLNTTDSSARKWAHASHGGLSVTNYMATWSHPSSSSTSGGKVFCLIKDLPRCIILPHSTLAWSCGAAGKTVNIGINEYTDYSGKDPVVVPADVDAIATDLDIADAIGRTFLWDAGSSGHIGHEGLTIPSPVDIILQTDDWLALTGFTLHLSVIEL